MSSDFSRIITLLRKEKGVTQRKAAEDLGVSQALLSPYEKGIRAVSYTHLDVYKRQVFDKVDFSYADRKILDQVSFTIPEKTTTAIVGPSGAGKTTDVYKRQRVCLPSCGDLCCPVARRFLKWSATRRSQWSESMAGAHR